MTRLWQLVGLIPAAVLVGSLSACSKPIPPERSAYIGDWRGSGMDLSIYQDGNVEYSRVQGGTTTSINMPIKEFQGDNFVVGVGPLSTTFVVSPPPHKDGSDWKMTVDGVELIKSKD